MDIFKCIKADHDEAADLFAALADLAADDQRTSDAMRIAVRLVIALKIHARAEERVVYPAMRSGGPRLVAFAREGHYEHGALDMLLDRLIAQRPGAELVAILKVARDQFEHHARHEEEAVILPLLAEQLTPTESLSLAHDFIHERRRIRPSIERLVGPAARGTHDGRGIHISHHRR
jgi:hypothetical protein